MKIGLRIDVDTFRGTRDGVPALCDVLAENSIKATFFFSVGPDNMGRNVWRLFQPAFLKKILRSNGPRLYGWDILLRGTFGQGPIIGDELREVIRGTFTAGHEIGFHAWDHYSWQRYVDKYSQYDIHDVIRKGVDKLADITGEPPSCSASPAWKANELVVKEKESFGFTYNSDCRGKSVFRPVVDAVTLKQPQIPVTLPTYDEVVGRNGVDDESYNSHIVSLLKPDALNVLTIHAEVEGMACASLFRDFIGQAKDKGGEFVPLGSLLDDTQEVPEGILMETSMPGRDGWLAKQR